MTGWMIFKAPSDLRLPVTDNSGKVTYVDVVPENEALFNVSRYGSYFLPILGVLILIIGAIQSVKVEARNRSLFITIIVAGMLIAALAFIITRWGYPTQFEAVIPASSDTLLKININPGRSLLGLESASSAIVALGLAVLGCSIAQLVKSRKIANTCSKEQDGIKDRLF
jgi:hypothetical protein